ncbi:MAG: hypothetical protein IKD35_03415 [Clostridia bacterium]|nr:hypothetical protein [Clostridia bacterium]
MYAIPVYTTTAFAPTNINAFNKESDGFKSKTISIDINSTSDNFNPTMPDLVRITFQNSSKYVFGTVLENASGDKLYARANGNTKLTGGKVNVLGTDYKLQYAYTAGLIYDPASEDDINAYNGGGLESTALFAKVGDRYVRVAPGAAVNGGEYYKARTETVDGVTYVKLDYSKLPTGREFPAGWISYDEYEFDWAGGAVEVGYKYQWGFSAMEENRVTVPVKGYEIDEARITSFAKGTEEGAEKRTSFTSFDAFGDLDSILANEAYNNSIAEYIKEFKYVNGRYTSGSYTNLSVEWDLTSLEKRLAEIKNGDSYDYYKGIDVVVTAKVGANVFRYITGYDKNGEPVYGFTGEGSTNADGSVAQVISVPVKVAGRIFEALEDESLVFDAYAHDTIDSDSFDTNVKALFAGSDKPVVLDSKSLTITAPFVLTNDEYVKVDPITNAQFSYLGYEGTALYARLDIGTEKSGKQTTYVPINVTAMTANIYRLTVEREHTLDPQWYNLAEAYNILTISFKEKGTQTHTMKPDWSTVKYYSNATYTKEIDNIYKGGTVFATVEANPCDAEGNILLGADGKALGSHNGQAQVIKIRLTVPRKDITSIKFLANTADVDMFTSGAIDTINESILKDINNYTASGYAEYVLDGKTYNLSTYGFVTNPDNYFRVGEWGDYRNGTAVAITYTTEGTEYTEFAFVNDWNINGLAVSSIGGDRYVVATVGAQQFKIKLATPSLAITDITLEGDSSVKFFGGSSTIESIDLTADTFAFEYDVFKAWSLPESATVKVEQLAGEFTGVDMEWLDSSTPGSLASDFVDEGGKKSFRTDDKGAYVLRKVRFFNIGGLVYPARDAIEVKIYLGTSDVKGDVTGAENVDTTLTAPKGLNLVYNAFSLFQLPTTADVVYTDGTPTREGVPVVWNAGAPTSSEVAQGTFKRTAYIGGNLMSAEYTFTVMYAYEVQGLGVAGDMSYTLTADKFYSGLPTSATIYPDKESKSASYKASLNWNVKYDNNGNITLGLNSDGTVNVKITANGITLDAKVKLTVEATRIAFADVNKTDIFVIDPLGSETTLFEAGKHTVLAMVGEGEDGSPIYQEVSVNASYTLPQDLYTNAVNYFGKTLTITVKFSYTGGSQSMTIKCQVLDKTIDKIVDPRYRSITVDPYRYDSFREGGLGLPLEIEAYLIDGTIATFVPEWPEDSIITSKGFEDPDYMVTMRSYALSANGTYVKYTYMRDGIAITRYGTEADAKAMGGTYNNDRYVMGTTQQVNIPVVVLDREVESAEFVTPEFEKAVRTDSRTTYTVRYISKDVTEGNIVDVIYGAKTNMPTDVVFYNGFAFGATAMPSEIDITFAHTGEVKRYYIVLEGYEQLAGIDPTKTKSVDVIVHVYPDHTKEFELFSFDVTFTVNKVSVTRYNSTLASDTMSSDLNYDSFEVYADADNGNSIYNTNKYSNTTTFYPDGKFVTLADWNRASADGYRTSKYLSTGEYIYKVLGNGTVQNNRVAVDSNGNRIGTPTYYQYDSTTKSYKIIATQGAPEYTYIFVYSVSQALNVSWNANETEIGVKGGEKTVYATVSANGVQTEVKVPVIVLDGTAVGMSASASDFASGAVADYMTEEGGTLVFTFDPYTNADALTELSTGVYKYFPQRATIAFANGSTADVPITWDFGIAKITCDGGTYNIYAVVDGSAYGIGEQLVRAKLVVLERTAVGIVEDANATLTSNIGYMWQNAEGKTQTYINPYEYYSSTLKLPESLTVNVVSGDGTEEQIPFSTTGSAYKLRWSTKDFRPTYKGGITYLTAKLTGPDGSTQNLQIPFLVQKMTVTNITTKYHVDEERVASAKIPGTRYNTKPYTADVNNGVAAVVYDMSDLGAFPKGLKVTFKIENPVVDSEGNVTFVETTVGTGWDAHKNGATNAKIFAYVSAITPLTITEGSTIGVQIGSGERIQIKVQQ